MGMFKERSPEILKVILDSQIYYLASEKRIGF
jgi:hypothetical protein